MANESIRSSELLETQRANQAREAENRRSNIARETETRRSNMAREDETHRSNVTVEGETHRSNVARETENTRSAVAREGENIRSALAREKENERTNKANEAIAIGRAATEAARLVEQIRHDKAMETKDYGSRVTVGGTTVSTPTNVYPATNYGNSNKPSNNKRSTAVTNDTLDTGASKSAKDDFQLDLGVLGTYKSGKSSSDSSSSKSWSYETPFGFQIKSNQQTKKGSH